MSKQNKNGRKLWIKVMAIALCALMVGSTFATLITYLIYLL